VDADQQLKEQFVDLMLMADDVRDQYRKRMGHEGEPSFDDALDFKDRLLFANAMMGLRLAYQRAEMAQEVGHPATATVVGEEVHTLNPKQVQQEFLSLIRQNKLDEQQAGRIMALMVSTEHGNRMLHVMLADAMDQKVRREMRAGRPAPPPLG